jgi:hypothetical protein
MSERHRQRVVRAEGRSINIVQSRAHRSYCFSGCCCGTTERGYAQVPIETYKKEGTRRKMIDDAVALVIHQDEPLEMNFPRKHYLRDLEKNMEKGEALLEARGETRRSTV